MKNTTKLPLEMKIMRAIWAAIPWDEPRDARDICAEAGIDPQRTGEPARFACQWFRDQGLPVISNARGFFKSFAPSNVMACYRNLRSRSRTIGERAEKVLEILERPASRAAVEEEASRVFSDIDGGFEQEEIFEI